MKPRILLVDDDEQNLILLSAKLCREGYEVETAKNGIEALEKLGPFHADLVLMDVMMPKMDGYEALRRMKSAEATRYIPVIMLTGKAEVEDRVMGFEVGAEDYIKKPYSLAEVAARVKSLLRMRALQARLRETEKMAALGEMVDGIAHEVRNPLTVLGGIARRLHESETDPRHMEYAEVILDSVERMERMLQRIDDYKTVLDSKLTEGDINEVVEEAAAEARIFIEAEGKDITVETALMPDPPGVAMDAANMKTALLNLLENSSEAIEREGLIRVETMPQDDETLSVRISDNGCGIGREKIREIFNPFQTSKFQGAGMGLTIAYRIVHDHGGEIEVASEPGEGTTVTIRLHPCRGASEAESGAEGSRG